MKLLRSFLIAIVLVVLTITIYLAQYLGAFKSVDISEAEKGPLKLLYKEHTGAYHKVVGVIEEVETWARQKGIDCSESFGEYLDNPNVTEENRLRSRGGCVVKEFPTADLPEGFLTREIPVRKYVVALFDGSPGIGPLKVYPKVENYMKEHRLAIDGPILEIYVIHSEKAMTTTYLFPAVETDAPPRPAVK